MAVLLNQPLTPDMSKLTKYLEQVHAKGWYTNFGPLHEELTHRLEKYLGVKNLLLVSNGTLAIQVACKALGIKSAITTPFSFVATTSSLLWQGIETAFSDIDMASYNLCPHELNRVFELDCHFDGIVATHVYGNPCDVGAIEVMANRYNKKVIYDAAHAFDVKVASESVLNFGDASTLSFHATKIFHTVEGGAIVFKKREDYLKAKELINFGIQGEGNLGEPGINAKLNEYQCAVGLTLLDKMEKVVEHRSELFLQYRRELKDAVEMPKWHPEASLNGAYFPIYIDDIDKQFRVEDALTISEIQFRRYFTPSLDLAYKHLKCFGAENSHRLAGGVFCVPLHNLMTKKDVKLVTDTIKRAL